MAGCCREPLASAMGRKQTLAGLRIRCPTAPLLCLRRRMRHSALRSSAPTFASFPSRPRRAYEWSNGKIVTFLVTLAATQSVTLAARGAGMSRKSAYALKVRDPAFADAWAKALHASKGHKVEEIKGVPVSPPQGDAATRAATSSVSTGQHAREDERRRQNAFRDRFFAQLASRRISAIPL